MWNKIFLNDNQVESYHDNFIIVKVPKTDYKFFHPTKLVNYYGNKLSISYSENWEFRFFKKDSYNYKTINVEEFESYFEGQLQKKILKLAEEKVNLNFEIEEDLIDN